MAKVIHIVVALLIIAIIKDADSRRRRRRIGQIQQRRQIRKRGQIENTGEIEKKGQTEKRGQIERGGEIENTEEVKENGQIEKSGQIETEPPLQKHENRNMRRWDVTGNWPVFRSQGISRIGQFAKRGQIEKEPHGNKNIRKWDVSGNWPIFRTLGGKVNKRSRIIEGSPAVDGQWPFVVSIQQEGIHFCGGSIVAEEWVLTASHCYIDEETGVLAEVSEFTVSVGSVYWKKGITHKVDQLIIHDDYDNVEVVNDIALLKMKTPFTFSETVKPIRPSLINIDDETEDVTATVIGWGYTNKERHLISKSSDILMYAQLHTIPWFKCKEFYSGIHSTNLCVTSESMKGSCNGDSGGPLVTYTRHGLVQIGLLSYGDDCNNTKPEVYTRVPVFIDWINSNIEKD